MTMMRTLEADGILLFVLACIIQLNLEHCYCPIPELIYCHTPGKKHVNLRIDMLEVGVLW